MAGRLFHHPLPEFQTHHLLRALLIALLALIAYLVICDTAAGGCGVAAEEGIRHILQSVA